MSYKLILLRHGESEWNAKNLFTGWVDVALSDKAILVEQIVPKDLRATNASIVADAFGLVEAQRRMRHSSSNITGKHYARPLAGRDTQVANHLDGLMSKQPALALAN